MTFRRALVLAATLAVLADAGWAQSYAAVQKWEGFYPTKQASGLALAKGRTFWDDALIKASLARTLAPDQLKQITGCWGALCTEDRIQIYDNMLAVHVCKSDAKNFRACQQWGAYIFFEMDSGRSDVCWNAMTAEDQGETPVSLWLWPGRSGKPESAAVESCTSATAFRYVAAQKAGKRVGSTPNGLPGETIAH